ncbi:MAG TPA: DUF2478 domain-containing protein [Rhodospirillales bacterium]|nr:DUF2478 domain-containing protein [Rhodospirillales bacterium]
MSDQNTQSPSAIRAAAVLYTTETTAEFVLSNFADELKAKGMRVGGLVQEFLTDDEGNRIGLDAIEVDTGARIPINRPTQSDRINGVCSLDRSALTESTSALRRAIADKVDLIVVEKFGEQEQKGSGLADEILAAMAEGIPTVVLVPAIALEEWTKFSGGMADLLPCSPDAVRRWWAD